MNRIPRFPPLAIYLGILSLAASGLMAQANGAGGDPAADPGGPPNGIPDCRAWCDQLLQDAVNACVGPDGTVDQQCADAAKANFDFDQCVSDCEAQNPRDVQVCHGACYETHSNGLQGCIDGSGNLDLECVAASDVEFVACLVACGEVPWLPDLEACATGCVQAYEQGVEACRLADRSIDPACFKQKRSAFSDCLGACGISLLPLEDPCVRRCEAAFQAAIEKCDPAVEPNGVPGDEECFATAQAAFDACLTDCGITIPDEILCARECDNGLKVRLAECQGDAACEKAALDQYSACLEGCGIVVPPIPDPDPCVSQCDLEYKESMGSCFDPATGVVDGDCLRQADEAYLACLQACGVILPDPPPDPNTECTAPCEVAYRAAIEKCYDVKADGTADVDQECVAAAESSYLACLESCGVDPGQPPDDAGFPAGECEQRCGVEILGALFDCAAQNGGAVDMECLARIGDAFNDCLAGCQQQAGEHLLGAVARGTNQAFRRGDADLSGALDITDAMRTLTFLFLGGATLGCEDAADANDDGRVNISDAAAVLGHLFLGRGPLPEPFAAPGSDPTPDGLNCTGR